MLNHTVVGCYVECIGPTHRRAQGGMHRPACYGKSQKVASHDARRQTTVFSERTANFDCARRSHRPTRASVTAEVEFSSSIRFAPISRYKTNLQVPRHGRAHVQFGREESLASMARPTNLTLCSFWYNVCLRAGGVRTRGGERWVGNPTREENP